MLLFIPSYYIEGVSCPRVGLELSVTVSGLSQQTNTLMEVGPFLVAAIAGQLLRVGNKNFCQKDFGATRLEETTVGQYMGKTT